MAGPARRWMAVLGVGALGLLPACGGLGHETTATVEAVRPTATASPPTAELAALPAPCQAVQLVMVEQALGVHGSRMVGPLNVGDGCGWHESTASCQMRAFGIDIDDSPGAATSFAAAQAAAIAPREVPGLGDRAFMTSDLGMMDASLPMTSVDVLDGGEWLHFALLGRAGADGEGVLLAMAQRVVGSTSG